MARNDRQPSTIMVTPLDLSAVEKGAAEYLSKHREVDGKSAVTETRTDKWAIVETPEGLFALCTEGVGADHPITDERPLVIDIWVNRYADTTQDFISMFPACTQKLTADELREMATGEQVALHDFIRSFGARLEANYASWVRRLETATAA